MEIYPMLISTYNCQIWTERWLKRVWRYQRGYQNPYFQEEQTTQWRTEKAQKDKQRSTKHTYKTKDRATRTSLEATKLHLHTIKIR